ncbi:Alpha/Beta hydrolase protein [Neohortaea acidophila]|uniref:Alpha/Beta hydrolase protein n=1 Tax=Neohortaea acidophila TaxID=245834 RepID=A0A6A6PXG1_9PEZI|nr:Alpha/Beta hydrolase protein [Neohortaea acidophila]KAF2484183.1 Alpha/Beta hydrolase protein [Neohortaea acidophila]
MASISGGVANNGEGLHYQELNVETGKNTVLMIHGALRSGDDWDLIVPHLPRDYHLLIPDLPGHGQSKDILPFSKKLSARLLADLIRKKALNGRAHVIGFSLGAGIGVQLISQYPDLIDVVFLSGYGAVSAPPSAVAAVLWAQERGEALLPKSMISWLMDGTDLSSSGSTVPSYALCRSIADNIHAGEEPSPWPARTLIVAAGKSGILPTADNADAARRLREIASTVQPVGQTKAYTHRQMRHPWCRQAPQLFAQTATMWFEHGTVPEGFEEL